METYYCGNLEGWMQYCEGYFQVLGNNEHDLNEGYQEIMKNVVVNKEPEPDNWYEVGRAYGILSKENRSSQKME